MSVSPVLAAARRSTVVRNYLSGLTLSTAGASTTFGVTAGVAADSTNADMLTLAAAISKTTAAWGPGSGNGALDTSTIAANAWYHVFLIKRADTGVIDVLISLSPSVPTMPANYSLFRRIGSMRTNASSQWIKFSQLGDEFLWDAMPIDVNVVTPGVATAQTATVSVPTGIQVFALGYAQGLTGTGADGRIAVTPFDISDQVQSAVGILVGINNASGAAVLMIRTNTSAQIRYRTVTTTGQFYWATLGWRDRRGQDG
jgi:hypothetical protein